MKQVEMAKLESMLDCAASAMDATEGLESVYRRLLELKKSVVLKEDRQAVENLLEKIQKAYEEAERLKESLAQQCSQIEQGNLKRGPPLFAAPRMPSETASLNEASLRYSAAEPEIVPKKRLWWNPSTWKK